MSYNRSYHRHFEDYVEKEVLDGKTGKRRIERTYAGAYYRHKMDDKAWVRLKRKYVLAFLWAVVCLLLQGFGGCTTAWYLAIPASLGLLAMVWLGFYVVSYALNGRDLEVRQYRDREMLKMTAMASGLTFLLLLAGQVAWMFLHRQIYLYGLLCVFTDASAFCCLYWLFRTERDMDYVKKENDRAIDPDSYDIRYREEE